MKLTTTSIRALALPAGLAEKTYFDDDLAGFGVRVRAGGSKTFVVQYKSGAKHRRMPLGAVAAIELGKARAAAKDLLAAVRLGRDPAGEKLVQRQKISTTFGALLPRYLERQRTRLKSRSLQEVARHLVTHAKPLHELAVETIDRRTIAVRVGEIAEQSGPAAANRVRASLGAYFAWLLREGILDVNPVLNTNKAPEAGARTHVIADDELALIWRALGEDQYSSIVKLLILCGCRRDEIASLRWSEIDLDRATITLPPERTKNRREHTIPLAPAALAILRVQPRRADPDGSLRDLVFGHGTRGFQDWSGSKAELDARIQPPIRAWHLHDFRRAMSTTMHERLGVAPWVVEAALGHADGHRAGIAGVYNKASYFDLRRIAMEKWADHVVALATGEQPPTVVTLRGRRI